MAKRKPKHNKKQKSELEILIDDLNYFADSHDMGGTAFNYGTAVILRKAAIRLADLQYENESKQYAIDDLRNDAMWKDAFSDN